MVITTAFQAEDGGSIPPTRSTIKLFSFFPTKSRAAETAAHCVLRGEFVSLGALRRASRFCKIRSSFAILILSRFLLRPIKRIFAFGLGVI